MFIWDMSVLRCFTQFKSSDESSICKVGTQCQSCNGHIWGLCCSVHCLWSRLPVYHAMDLVAQSSNEGRICALGHKTLEAPVSPRDKNMQWWGPYISPLNFLWRQCWCSRLPCQGKWPKPQPSDPDLGSTCQHTTPCHFACLPPCHPSPVDAYRADWHFELLLNLCHLHNHVLRCSSKFSQTTMITTAKVQPRCRRDDECLISWDRPNALLIVGCQWCPGTTPYILHCHLHCTISSTAIQLPLKQAK